MKSKILSIRADCPSADVSYAVVVFERSYTVEGKRQHFGVPTSKIPGKDERAPIWRDRRAEVTNQSFVAGPQALDRFASICRHPVEAKGACAVPGEDHAFAVRRPHRREGDALVREPKPRARGHVIDPQRLLVSVDDSHGHARPVW